MPYQKYAGGGFPVDDLANAIWATGYPSYINTCQSWTEDSWSSEANEGSLAQASGGGNSSAFMRAGGNTNSGRLSSCSSFNGSTWGAEASFSNSWYETGGDGIPTKFIQVSGVGGTCGTTTRCDECNTYNGTSWSSITSYTAATNGNAVGGNSDGCLSVGGETSLATTESWNGSAWTSETHVGYDTAGGCCSGTGALNVYYCGTSAGVQQNACSTFDGGTWTTQANASTYSRLSNRGGSGTSGAMRVGGRGGTGSGADYSYLDTTEVFQPSLTWSTKASISAAVYQLIAGGGA